MARINVEQKALTDPRFAVLGKLLGVSPFEALGRMLHVWNECQERGSYYLSGTVLDGIFSGNEVGHVLVRSELARETKTKGFYIRGSRGRVEWLRNRRLDGKKGGRPKQTLGLTQGIDRKHPAANPPAPAPAPALIPESPVPELLVKPASRAVARNVSAGNGKPDTPSPEFAEWWDTYRAALKEQGRSCGYKRASWDTWKRNQLDQHVAGIVDRLRAQLAFWKRAQGTGNFVPLLPDPHRWLKQKRWHDEVPKSWERQA